jgi:hypothetical protein
VPLGEWNGQALLTEGEVVEIRQCYLTGSYSYVELAARFGVTKSTIQSILSAINWQWLLADGEGEALARMRAERQR